jgi:hypothetical protein
MGAVIIATRYVPRPPEDALHNIKSGQRPAVLPSVGGNFPFKASYWRFGQDDAAVWVRSSYAVPPVRDLVGGNFPFVNTRWRFGLDQPREWVGGPTSAFNLLSQTLQLYAPSIMRSFPIGDDGDKWNGNRQSVNNLLLNTAVALNPFLPVAWRFDYQDPNPGWVAESQPVPPVSKLVGGGFPFAPVFWKFNYDDASLWTVKTFSVPKVQALVGGGFPIIPVRPQFHYHDAPVWHAKPTPTSRQLINLLAGNPFPPKRWVFDYNDASFWAHPVPRNGFGANQPAPAIDAVLAATESPDVASFSASFSGVWTARTIESETWTPATKESETWTPS